MQTHTPDPTSLTWLGSQPISGPKSCGNMWKWGVSGVGEALSFGEVERDRQG